MTSADRKRGVYCIYIYTYKPKKSHNIPGISVSPHLQVDGDKLRHFTWGHWGANSSLGLNIVWQEGPLPDGDTWPKVGGLAARVLTFIAAVDLLLKLENLGCQLVIHVFEFLKWKRFCKMINCSNHWLTSTSFYLTVLQTFLPIS